MIQGFQPSHAVLAILLIGLGSNEPGEKTPAGGPPSESAEKRGPARAEPIEAPGVEKLFRLAPQLYSGAQPEGNLGFETLKKLGIKTIISVDGAWPDAEQARRLGMRYIHLPVGYDGIAREQAVRLVKAMRDLPGPLFVHCHHGMHRGPTAAALCALATTEWDRDQAHAWLEHVGTDPKYKGLYATVDQFAIPSPEELAQVGGADLPERAVVPGLVEAMVQIDQLWDHLKAAQKSDFRATADHPDLDPAHDATLLAEQFREVSRFTKRDDRGPEFAQLMTTVSRDSAALEQAILDLSSPRTPASTQAARAAFTKVGRHCSTCHARFRDQ